MATWQSSSSVTSYGDMKTEKASTGVDFSSGLPTISPGTNTPTSGTNKSSNTTEWYGGGMFAAPSKITTYGLVMPIAGWKGTLPKAGTSAGIGSPREYRNGTHQGIDMSAPTGTPLLAVVGGKVTSVHTSPNGGKIVHLQGEDGTIYKYMHMDTWAVKTGQTVQQGQVLGTVGQTGAASGPHLHFEVWQSGKPIDPTAYLQGGRAGTVSGGDAIYADTGASGGSGSSGASAADKAAFYDWMGRNPSASEQARMVNEGWNIDVLRRYAISSGGTGPMMQETANTIRQIGAGFYGGDPSAVPESVVKALIDGGYSESYIKDVYFPMMRGASLTNPASQPYIDAWIEMTGRPLTYTATQKLSEFVKAYGYSGNAEAAWVAWVKTTDSANTGNYGAEHRAAIGDDIGMILGRAATDTELTRGNQLWDLNDEARMEYLRTTPEYQAIYAGKPVWMDEAAFIDNAMAYDQVMRWYYGDGVTMNADGSLSIPMGQYETPQGPAQNYTAPSTPAPPAPVWKSLTNAQFAADLSAYGVTVNGTSYMKDGQAISLDQLEALLPKDTYYRDSQGFHYVQEEGALNPKTGQAAVVTKPRVTTPGTVPNTAGLGNWGISYVNGQIVTDLLGSNVTPGMLQQQFQWTEEASYMSGVYNETLAEAYGSGYSSADWYKIASGAQGSGAMRAQIQQAQNRVAFREVYRDYFGTDPGPSDYDAITSQFVSPNEFAHRMAAKESAKAKIDQINELLGRTLDTQVSIGDLENLAMGGQGSGAIQAMIDQATRLDQYTDILYQYKGGEPTADDYAEVAGYPSAAAFKWEITVVEQMDEMRDDINEAMTKVYGTPMSEDQLKIMLGRSEGWGELQAKYNKAQEEENKKDSARSTAMNIDKISPIYTAAEQGGFKPGLPGLGEIGA